MCEKTSQASRPVQQTGSPLAARLLPCLLLWGALAGSARYLPAQQAPAPTVIRTTAGEVLFDMVVTDKHGKIVRDLRPQDVTIQDNGVPQKVVSFALVSHSVHLGAKDLAALDAHGFVAPARLPQFNLIAIAFDQMDAGANALARKGAEEFVNKDLGPQDYAAVLRFDLRTYALQPFTADRQALLNAIATATGGSARRFQELSRSANDEEAAAAKLEQQAQAAMSQVGQGAPPTQAAMSAMAEAKMAQMVADSLSFSAAQETTDSSRATLNNLLGIVQSLKALPGRKVLLYFTQYLPVNSNTDFLFHSLINQANTYNVSIYTVDPTGLNLETENQQAAGNLNQSANVSRTEQRVGAVSMEQANESETTENIQYASRRLLASLAESTGGFYISNTNDLARPMENLATDIDAHYELSYAPSAGMDGKYHTIEVRLDRPSLVVRARKGYYATGLEAGASAMAAATAGAAEAAQPFEKPLFTELNSTPAPVAIPVTQTVFQFPGRAAQPTLELMMEIPLASFAVRPLANHKSGEHLSVLALIKNAQDQAVAKFSQDLSFPAAAHEQHFIFERTLSLPPGAYSLNSVVYEPETQKAGVLRTPVTVAAGEDGKLRLSSVVVIKGAQALPKKSAGSDPNPLHYQDVAIIPDLGQPLLSGPNAKLGFFFVVYPPKGTTPQLTLTFNKDGQPMGKAQEPLSAPDSSGRIVVSPAFPLASFPPGDYSVVVEVTAGGQTAAQTASFRVAAQGQ